MSFIEEWIETKPEDRSPLKSLGVVIRGLKTAIRERLGVEHITYSEGDDTKDDTGRHKAGECSVCYIGSRDIFPHIGVPKGAIALDSITMQISIYDGTKWCGRIDRMEHNNLMVAPSTPCWESNTWVSKQPILTILPHSYIIVEYNGIYSSANLNNLFSMSIKKDGIIIPESQIIYTTFSHTGYSHNTNISYRFQLYCESGCTIQLGLSSTETGLISFMDSYHSATYYISEYK